MTTNNSKQGTSTTASNEPQQIAKRFNIQDGEILLVTNIGDFVINYEQYDEFVEFHAVDRGEQGFDFKVLLVVDCYNRKFVGEMIDFYFRGDEE